MTTLERLKAVGGPEMFFSEGRKMLHSAAFWIYNLCSQNFNCTMLHLFDDLLLDKMIPKNNDRYKAIQSKLQKVRGRCLILCSGHYVFSLRIPFIKIKMQTIDKPAVTKRCRCKITEGQWAVLNFV